LPAISLISRVTSPIWPTAAASSTIAVSVSVLSAAVARLTSAVRGTSAVMARMAVARSSAAASTCSVMRSEAAAAVPAAPAFWSALGGGRHLHGIGGERARLVGDPRHRGDRLVLHAVGHAASAATWAWCAATRSASCWPRSRHRLLALGAEDLDRLGHAADLVAAAAAGDGDPEVAIGHAPHRRGEGAQRGDGAHRPEGDARADRQAGRDEGEDERLKALGEAAHLRAYDAVLGFLQVDELVDAGEPFDEGRPCLLHQQRMGAGGVAGLLRLDHRDDQRQGAGLVCLMEARMRVSSGVTSAPVAMMASSVSRFRRRRRRGG
jgi:hypothetical protein